MKKVWWVIIGSVIALVLLPLAIDWLIIGNNFPSNVSNSDWVGFLGSYIGSIVGCVVSLVGILWTIRFTRDQNRADRELQIKPFLDIRYREPSDKNDGSDQLGYLMINILEHNDAELLEIGSGDLIIKNVGNGPATNIRLDGMVFSSREKYKAVYSSSRAEVTTTTVNPEKSAKISFEICSKHRAPSNNELKPTENKGLFILEDGYTLPNRFSFEVVINYNDLLSNQYSQKLMFSAKYVLNEELRVEGRLPCLLHLDLVTPPQLLRR